MRLLNEYRSLVFDCDGVVLDSNKVKTMAFHAAALPYGKEAADALVEYHVANGGVSRYRKFEYFLREIIRHDDLGPLEQLLARYAELVKEGLLGCRVAGGLQELREATGSSNWLIVSGGDQGELREVFAARGLATYFDGGIYGSPDDKSAILAREIERGNIRRPALFIGDSRFDYLCATAAGLDFVFVSEWTEFAGWEEYFAAQSAPVAYRRNIASLLTSGALMADNRI